MAKRQARTPTPVDRRLGQQVRAVRMQCGVSQEALADAIGVTFQQLHKYEQGTNRIAASRIVEIAISLNVPILALFEGVEVLQRATMHGSVGSDEATRAPARAAD